MSQKFSLYEDMTVFENRGIHCRIVHSNPLPPSGAADRGNIGPVLVNRKGK